MHEARVILDINVIGTINITETLLPNIADDGKV